MLIVGEKYLMQQLILSREDSQAIDRSFIEKYAIPGVVLMENAGRGIVDVFLNLKPQGKVLICCGGGNNGGDGLVVARHLNNLHIPVQVLLFVEPSRLQGDAKTNYEIVKRLDIQMQVVKDDLQVLQENLANAEWVIDALFGTGLKSAVREPFVQVIQMINKSGKNVLAVDVPSGLDCDTGEVLGAAIQARHTVTMVALKKGFIRPGADLFLGKVDVVGIGGPSP